MAENRLIPSSVYAGSCIVLTTKHAKSIAIAPSFWDKLRASVIEYVANTDELGTFSGEVARSGNALECVRRKCEWSLERFGNKIEFALASEGSFGHHPSIPFLPCDHEMLYFIDCRHDFHLYLSHVSKETNYRMELIDSLENLNEFAKSTLFPSHALILRPNDRSTKHPIFKGINSQAALEEAFIECNKLALKGKVWVETDMRAHLNPSRMKVIRELSENFSSRLATPCPSCAVPGWGAIGVEKGLICSGCGEKTILAKHEIYGCGRCVYQEFHKPAHGLEEADPGNCQYCNP
ncbi:MAG: hypothetical protein K2Q33_07825 [Gammaproteobacteria bacterium]|nr:hypothetical protein [Gammaproteobacteria bacterium]